jgi:hypothetical protein
LVYSGIIVLADQIRGDASLAIKELRQAGVAKIILPTGDRPMLQLLSVMGSQMAGYWAILRRN